MLLLLGLPLSQQIDRRCLYSFVRGPVHQAVLRNIFLSFDRDINTIDRPTTVHHRCHCESSRREACYNLVSSRAVPQCLYVAGCHT